MFSHFHLIKLALKLHVEIITYYYRAQYQQTEQYQYPHCKWALVLRSSEQENLIKSERYVEIQNGGRQRGGNPIQDGGWRDKRA